jgi:hypothetical protein
LDLSPLPPPSLAYWFTSPLAAAKPSLQKDFLYPFVGPLTAVAKPDLPDHPFIFSKKPFL